MGATSFDPHQLNIFDKNIVLIGETVSHLYLQYMKDCVDKLIFLNKCLSKLPAECSNCNYLFRTTYLAGWRSCGKMILVLMT